jgi:SAM-dependent methyltransferase
MQLRHLVMYDHPSAAAAYDLIHAGHGKGYDVEAGAVADHIRRFAPDARTLLDVACGTGTHLQAFAAEGFDVVGIELSPVMAQAARTKNAGVEVHGDDMRTFRLDRRFDAVVCLFSSIGYMTSLEDLVRAIGNMSEHLAEGGVLLIERWFAPEQWGGGLVRAESGWNDDLAVARVSRSWREGPHSVFDLHYVIADREGSWEFVERHRMGLYTEQQYREAFVRAGCAVVDHVTEVLTGRGLLIGIRSGAVRSDGVG